MALPALASWFRPLQSTDGFASALCELGLGDLITLGLFLGALVLAYLTFVDIFAAFKEKRSKTGDRNAQQSHYRDAGMHGVGAVIVGGLPILANAAGFSLLGCVDPVNLLTGGGTLLLPVLL